MGGGGYITCLGYGYVSPIWMGFWAQNSLNRGPFFGRFSFNMGALSMNLQKIAKIGRFPPKFIIELGMTASFGN